MKKSNKNLENLSISELSELSASDICSKNQLKIIRIKLFNAQMLGRHYLSALKMVKAYSYLEKKRKFVAGKLFDRCIATKQYEWALKIAIENNLSKAHQTKAKKLMPIDKDQEIKTMKESILT